MTQEFGFQLSYSFHAFPNDRKFETIFYLYFLPSGSGCLATWPSTLIEKPNQSLALGAVHEAAPRKCADP